MQTLAAELRYLVRGCGSTPCAPPRVEKPWATCECGQLRSPSLVKYDCITLEMAAIRAGMLLCAFFISALYGLERLYGAGDGYFALFLLVYPPLLNTAVLRSRTETSLASPAPNIRVLRTLFLLTASVSVIAPTVLLTKLANDVPIIQKHLWLVLAQLANDTAISTYGKIFPVALLVRIVITAVCIVYRLPVTHEWLFTQTPDLSPTWNLANRAVAAANFIYWVLCLLWYLFGVVLPYHARSPREIDQSSPPRTTLRSPPLR